MDNPVIEKEISSLPQNYNMAVWRNFYF